MVEGAPKVATPPTAEQPTPADKEAPAPSMEGTPQPGKDEKQTMIPGMGDPAPRRKGGGFYHCPGRDRRGQATEKAAAPDKGKQADKAKDTIKPSRGCPPKVICKRETRLCANYDRTVRDLPLYCSCYMLERC